MSASRRKSERLLKKAGATPGEPLRDDIDVGDRVTKNFIGHGWAPGEIKRIQKGRTTGRLKFTVQFSLELDEKQILECRHYGPNIDVGDRVTKNFTGHGWAPGEIKRIQKGRTTGRLKFTVQFSLELDESQILECRHYGPSNLDGLPPNKKGKLDPAVAIASDTAAPSPEKIMELLAKKAKLGGGEGDPPVAETKLMDPTQFLGKDIWMNILSFVGPGHYIYFALVSKEFKQLYKASFALIEKPPRVLLYANNSYGGQRPAEYSDTFYRAAFSSVACAEYWKEFATAGNSQGRCLQDDRVSTTVAKYGNLEVLKWSQEPEQQYPWGALTCALAAGNGHLDCLKYAHQEGCDWNGGTCCFAAGNGHLECLKYAHEEGCEWDEDTCTEAAENGHLECLQYAHDNGCKWDEETCTGAAMNGHLECLQYAHEQECEWDGDTCTEAARNGQLECLQYAHEQECKWDELTCGAAADSGQLECLKYLHENGCEWNEETCTWAAANGHLECLRYAQGNGCECEKASWRLAASYGHLEVLKYIYAHGRGEGGIWDEAGVRESAQCHHQQHILEWLDEVNQEESI